MYKSLLPKVIESLLTFYLLTFRETQSCYVHSPSWPLTPILLSQSGITVLQYGTVLSYPAVANPHPAEVLGNQT